MSIDRTKARRAIADFLSALGYDHESDSELKDTPARVVEAFEHDLLSGRRVDLEKLLSTGSVMNATDDTSGIVVVEDIEVTTMCPHHLMPAQGKALVAYIPKRHVLGLGRIASLVDACARRLVLQEQIGRNVVDALMAHAGAEGAFCRLSLVHSCLTARGSRQANSAVHTVASGGTLSGTAGHSQVALAIGRGAFR